MTNINENPRLLPWLTKEAIKFLEKFLNQKSDAKILEFGCGGSTIWFSKRTKNLISIEHNFAWYKKIKDYLNNHPECNKVDLRLIQENYYEVTNKFADNYFDLILIDGMQRVKCANASITKLKKGGILMLDNAERHSYKKIYELLKNWKFHKTIQDKPDSYDSFYENWQTNWWIKPV